MRSSRIVGVSMSIRRATPLLVPILALAALVLSVAVPSGAHSYLDAVIVRELQADGAAGFDLAGANIPSVAAAKANFGARLVPYFTVEGYGVKPLAKWVRGWWRFMERSRARHAASETAGEPAESAPVQR
jgi:hypothetical protein